MSVTPPIPVPYDAWELRDLRVDNDGFFDAVESRLSDVLTADDIHRQARLELKSLISDMKRRQIIRGVTEWTAAEQKTFLDRVRQEIVDTGALFSARLRDTMRSAIEQEVWREINDDGQKIVLQDGGGNSILSSLGDYQYFLATSFLVEQETSIIPMDLSLTVSEGDTIEMARAKIDRYGGRYNALVLLGADHRPVWVIKTDTLDIHASQGHATLEGISLVSEIFGHYGTPRADIMRIMRQHDINIVPIVDSVSGILIGILTARAVEQKELHYYSTVSLSKLSLDYLKSKQEAFV